MVNTNPYSRLAWEQVTEIQRNRTYQKILAVLSNRNCTREELSTLTHINENTLRPRIVELRDTYGVIMPMGEGTTRTGRRCEKLGITCI